MQENTKTTYEKPWCALRLGSDTKPTWSLHYAPNVRMTLSLPQDYYATRDEAVAAIKAAGATSFRDAQAESVVEFLPAPVSLTARITAETTTTRNDIMAVRANLDALAASTKADMRKLEASIDRRFKTGDERLVDVLYTLSERLSKLEAIDKPIDRPTGLAARCDRLEKERAEALGLIVLNAIKGVVR